VEQAQLNGRFQRAALAGIAGVAAINADGVISHVVSRQLSASDIPSACNSSCGTALTIYNACTSGDTTTCLGVCQPDTFSSFTGCFECIVQDTPGVTQTEVDELNAAVAQLEAVCQQAGQTVSADSIVLSGGASASATDASATGSATSGLLATATDASFSSTSGGLTIVAGGSSGAASASATSRSGGIVASATSAAGGAASSAAGSTTGAGSFVATVPGFAGLAAGMVGIVAGAAFLL